MTFSLDDPADVNRLARAIKWKREYVRVDAGFIPGFAGVFSDGSRNKRESVFEIFHARYARPSG